MVNSRQAAIIKKDVKGIIFDKTLFPVLLIVPVVFTVVLPTIFIFMAYFGQDSLSDIRQLMDMLPIDGQPVDDPIFIIEALMNYIMPVFFMIIPIMAAMIMAASSFVGEKENRTLETLFYSPLSLKSIFQAKVLASFMLSMLVSVGSFFLMVLVVEVESLLIIGSSYRPSLNWLITMVLVSPAISLISITLIVRGSAKARTMQEAQQKAVFLVLPILLLVVGQFTGIFFVGPILLLVLGIVFTLIAALLVKGAIGKFNYEALLK